MQIYILFPSGLLAYVYNHVLAYRGDWDTEGVRVVSIDINTSTVICNSTHLTSFAVLVDVSGGHNVRNHVVIL